MNLKPCPLCFSDCVIEKSRKAFFTYSKKSPVVVCAVCGCTANAQEWQKHPRNPTKPAPAAKVPLETPVDLLEDASLATMLRTAQAMVRRCTEVLTARGFVVWANPKDRRYLGSDYSSDLDYQFTIRKSKVIETEKEL